MPTDTMRSNGPGNVAIVLEQEFADRVRFFSAARAFETCNCSVESVTPVTSAPVISARYSPRPPQPEPMSSTRSPRLDQQLGGEMAFLGELGIVEARVRRFEIGAAILLVGIEEERIEPPVEIVMARDIVSRDGRAD